MAVHRDVSRQRDFRHAIGGCMLVLERFSERLRCRFWRWVG